MNWVKALTIITMDTFYTLLNPRKRKIERTIEKLIKNKIKLIKFPSYNSLKCINKDEEIKLYLCLFPGELAKLNPRHQCLFILRCLGKLVLSPIPPPPPQALHINNSTISSDLTFHTLVKSGQPKFWPLYKFNNAMKLVIHTNSWFYV